MTPGFQSTAARVETSDGRNCVLLEPLVYVRMTGEIITVPAGTTTDGASTPRLLWRLIPPFGRYWPAAVLHDYLYRFTDRPKDVCDSILREAMLSLGVDEVTTETIYEGVNLGGWKAFREDRKDLISKP